MPRTAIHPGEILADELEARGLTCAGLARAMEVPENRISQIVAGKRNITADTALRLSQCFGTSAELWAGLQSTYELDRARAETGEVISRLSALSSTNDPNAGSVAPHPQP